MPNSLPPSLTSLYRLVRRAASASVLHQSSSKKYLRRLYRPTFEAAVTVVRKIDEIDRTSFKKPRDQRHSDVVLKENYTRWLELFEQRMDHQLSFLYASSHSRGLPHRVTQNLSRLHYNYQRWPTRFGRGVWNPQLRPDDPAYYTKGSSSRDSKQRQKMRDDIALGDKVFDQVIEVMQMAEGRDGLALGRPRIVKKYWEH